MIVLGLLCPPNGNEDPPPTTQSKSGHTPAKPSRRRKEHS
jgi:hypothetical protein